MPTYQYICKNCNHEFEKFQSIKAEPCKKCPECNKNSLKRVTTGGAGLIFKGSGFYITDYKKTNSVTKSDLKKSQEISSDTKPKKSESENKT